MANPADTQHLHDIYATFMQHLNFVSYNSTLIRKINSIAYYGSALLFFERQIFQIYHLATSGLPVADNWIDEDDIDKYVF